jgi:hypothetical protein
MTDLALVNASYTGIHVTDLQCCPPSDEPFSGELKADSQLSFNLQALNLYRCAHKLVLAKKNEVIVILRSIRSRRAPGDPHRLINVRSLNIPDR